MAERTCSIPSCNGSHRAKGLCATHYNQQLPNRHVKASFSCAVCGALVHKHAAGTRRHVCSYRCRHYLRFGRWPLGAELVGPVKIQTHPRVARPQEIEPTKRGFISGPCAWCGEHFVWDMRIGGWPSRCCSDRCSKARMRANRADKFRIAPVVRLAIYERDDWTCQLCFEPIDRDADYLSDWAPSLDHIECQSWVLVPDHSPENLRTAHRWCNAVRNDGRGDDFFQLTA